MARFKDRDGARIHQGAVTLTFSVAAGLSLGLFAYTVVKVAAGRFREASLLV
jgi:xanthine/uracil/vitamin C permease (AzgA family)